MKVKFRTGVSAITYWGVSKEDAEKVLNAHLKGNRGTVLIKTWRKTVSVDVSEFRAVEIW